MVWHLHSVCKHDSQVYHTLAQTSFFNIRNDSKKKIMLPRSWLNPDKLPRAGTKDKLLMDIFSKIIKTQSMKKLGKKLNF